MKIEYVDPTPELAKKATDLMLLWKESLPHFATPDKEKIEQFFNNESYFRKLAIVDGDMAGLMIGFAGCPFYSSEVVAGDLGVYVGEKFRGLGIAMNLIAMFEDWAKSKGVKNVWIGQTTGFSDVEKLKSSYASMGYVIRGVNASKEL